MNKVQAYYDEAQSHTGKFHKLPNHEAAKHGVSKEQNEKMFQAAKAHQEMIRDLEGARKANRGNIHRRKARVTKYH